MIKRLLAITFLACSPVVAQTPVGAGFFGNTFFSSSNVGVVTANGCRTWSAVNWRQWNTGSGTYSWTTFDALRAACGNANIVLPLAGTPNYASSTSAATCSTAVGNAGNGGCNPPSDVDSGDTQWKTALTAAATHWYVSDTTHPHYYAVWNEPNQDSTQASGSQMWNGTLSQLAKMACDAYTVIHANDPQARVMTPEPTSDNRYISSSPVGPAYWLSQYFPVVQAQSGLSSGAASICADVVAWHFYPHTLYQGFGYYGGPPQSNPEINYFYIAAINATMSSYNVASLPLDATEGNWGNFSDPTYNGSATTAWESGWMMEWHLMLLSSGAEKVWWYAVDTGFSTSSCIANWGGLWNNTDSTICAQGTAYNWLLTLLSGGSYAGTPCSRSNDGTWICNFTRGDNGRPVYFVWNFVQPAYGNGQKVVSIPLNPVAVLNVDQTAATVTNHTITLPSNGAPIIVEM